ncbi:hypothetical protein V8E51_007723 [Hyaloscypha variabilis]
MGDIYANAQKVICWIGDHNHSKSRIWAQIQYFIHIKLTSHVDMNRYFWAKSYLIFLFDISEVLENSTWIERVWTVQEFALGKEIYLQCGKHQFLHKNIYHLVSLGHYSGLPFGASRVPKIKRLFQTHEFARRVYREAPSLQVSQKPSNAMSTMVGNRSKLASEPKDRIFSLFSIFKQAGIHISEPDYNRSLEDISHESTSALIRGGCSLQFLESTFTPEPWPSWVPDLSQHIFERRAPGCFKAFDGERFNHELQGRKLRVRLAARVEQVARVSTAYLRFESSSLGHALWRLCYSDQRLMRVGTKGSPLEDKIKAHLISLGLMREFLVEAADIWTDNHFRNIPSDDRLPPEERPPNARVVLNSLLRHLSYAIKDDMFSDLVVQQIPHFLWALMDNVFVHTNGCGSGFNSQKPSRRTKVLESSLGTLPQWQAFIFLENCSPYFIESPYDHLREAFQGSRCFATSSGICGFATESVQEGDLVVRIIGMSTLMVIRPSGDDAFRLISPADVDYDFLLPEIEEMWKEEGEWITIS